MNAGFQKIRRGGCNSNTKSKRIMDLKEFLISIGRMPREEEDTPGQPAEQTGEIITVGDLFDAMKAMGYKRMPRNASVNAGTWKGRIMN